MKFDRTLGGRSVGMLFGIVCMLLLLASHPALAQPPLNLDQWRQAITITRALAENDAPKAYQEAQQLQTNLPINAMPEDKARVLNLLARVEVYLGLTAKAAQHAQQAFELAKQNGDPVGQAESDLSVALNAVNQGRLDALNAAVTHSMYILEGVNRPDLLAEAMLRTAMMYRRLERFDESIAMTVQNLEIAKRSHNALALAYAHEGMAVSYEVSGRYAEARSQYTQVLEQARIIGSKRLEAEALLGQSIADVNLGDKRGGEKLNRQVIDMSHAMGMPFYTARAQFTLADVLRRQGRVSESIVQLNNVVDIYVIGANNIGLWWALNARSESYQALGRIQEAHADAARAYKIAKAIDFPHYQSTSARRLAEIAAARGDYKRAYAFAAEAEKLSAKGAQEKAGEQMVELAQRYEEKSRREQIDELNRRNERQAAELENKTLQQRWLWTVLGASVVILIGAALFLLRLRRSHHLLAVANSQLQQTQDDLLSLNVSLEQRVQARTAELRQQTNYLRTLIDMLPMWAWFKDTHGRFLAVNRAVADTVNQAAEAMVGRTSFDCFPSVMAASQQADDEAVMFSRGHKVIEEEITDANGQSRWTETYKAAVLDDDGSLLGTVGVARDISERKVTEAAREAALFEAERLASLRSAFMAQMSHELRTPLNGILGYTQILRRDNMLNDRQKMGLGVIQQSGEHLLRLINDILDFAKIEAGKQELSLTDIPLESFLRSLAAIISVKADVKGLGFRLEAAADLPVVIRADETRLKQVLLNLLSNAVKYTERGLVVLRVAAMGPGKLRFTVQDSGCGISTEMLETIFQPFEQVGMAKYRAGGTGLGLAISRNLVRLMGSDIQVESEPGVGSTFWFDLDAAIVGNEVSSKPAEWKAIGYYGKRRKVLVVDDLEVNRRLLLDMLGDLGFEMVEAESGRECLQKVQESCPDLILMDIVMPELDGLEATRLLRQMPKVREVPIIALSAIGSGADIESSIEAGVNVCLPKPVDMGRLLAQMTLLLKIEWIYAEPKDQSPASDDEPACLEIPPPEEMRVLHHLAQEGSMRDIIQRADYLVTLDRKYRLFADQLRLLAQSYQSKAILSMVELYLNDSGDD